MVDVVVNETYLHSTVISIRGTKTKLFSGFHFWKRRGCTFLYKAPINRFIHSRIQEITRIFSKFKVPSLVGSAFPFSISFSPSFLHLFLPILSRGFQRVEGRYSRPSMYDYYHIGVLFFRESGFGENLDNSNAASAEMCR